MEICVTETDVFPVGSILSVRAGESRRQAPVASLRQQPLKFPAPHGGGPLKIDVLQNIGRQVLELVPGQSHYPLIMEVAGRELAFALGVKTGSSEAAVGKKARLVQAATEANAYLEKTGFLDYLQELIRVVLQTKPADPFLFMWDRLGRDKVKRVPRRRREAPPASSFRGDAEMPLHSAAAQEGARLKSAFRSLQKTLRMASLDEEEEEEEEQELKCGLPSAAPVQEGRRHALDTSGSLSTLLPMSPAAGQDMDHSCTPSSPWLASQWSASPAAPGWAEPPQIRAASARTDSLVLLADVTAPDLADVPAMVAGQGVSQLERDVLQWYRGRQASPSSVPSTTSLDWIGGSVAVDPQHLP